MDYNEPDLSMPYHAYWRRDASFRNALSWEDVTVLHVEPAGRMDVQVLRIEPEPRRLAGVPTDH